MHVANNKNNALLLDEGTTQGLDKNTIIAEAKYPINFTESGRKYVLSLEL